MIVIKFSLQLTIASNIICGRSYLLHKTSSHILEPIFELDALCNRYAIFGNLGSTIWLFYDDTTPLKQQNNIF